MEDKPTPYRFVSIRAYAKLCGTTTAYVRERIGLNRLQTVPFIELPCIDIALYPPDQFWIAMYKKPKQTLINPKQAVREPLNAKL